MTDLNNVAMVRTIANENYFPQRLIFRVDVFPKAIDILNNLRCVFQDPDDNDQWYITCSEEMLKITNWNSQYIDAIKKEDPIVVASIRFLESRTMHVYIRCFQRVVPILQFICQYFPKDVVVGTHHDTCFKITLAMNNDIPTPEQIFANESDIMYSENMRRVDALEEKARLTGKNYNKQIDALFNKEFSPNHSRKRDIADLERRRLEMYYVDGAQDYQQAMTFQETLAIARFYAGGTLNSYEFMEKIIKNGGKPITDLKKFIES